MKDWKFASHLPGFYVCPDLFQLPLDGDSSNLCWVIMDWERYPVVDFDGKSVKLFTKVRRLDEASGKGTDMIGLGASANQTWKVGTPANGRIVQIAWLREGEYPGMKFSQQMTFPTQLSLRTLPEGIRLARLPIPEITSLYSKTHRIAPGKLSPASPNPLASIKAECMDIQAVFNLCAENTADRLSVNIRGVDITYDTKTKTIFCLGRSAAIEPVDQKLGIRVLVDRTSLEIYIDDGRLIFTFYHFFDPAKQDMAISVNSGSMQIASLNLHEIE